MSGIPNNMRVGMDISDFEAGSQQMANLLEAQAKQLQNATIKMTQFNAAGVPIRATVEGINSAGQKMTETFANVNGVLIQTKSTLSQVGDAAKDATGSFAVSIQSLARILEVQLFRRGVTAIVNSIQQGVRTAFDYQISLQQVGNVANLSGTQINELAQNVRRLSETYNVTQVEALGAAQIALTSQLGNTAKAYQIVNEAAKLATATGINLSTSTRLVTTAMEAYGLQGDQAGHVTDVLFQTSQRTRIPLDQLQNSIGRVGITANRLGISFDQVIAMFLTLSQQGRRPTEAMAALNQVMARLIEPGRELRELFLSWGTPTADAAIRIYGVSGVLNRLNAEMQRSPERMHEIAGSLRTLNGLLGITGQGTINFGENLRAITEGGGLDEAAARVQQTPAQQLRNQFQQIRNIFTEEVGNKVIESTVTLVKTLGGVQNILENVTGALKIGAAAWLVYETYAVGAVVSTRAGLASLATSAPAAVAVAAISIVTGVSAEIDKLIAESKRKAEAAARDIAESTRRMNEQVTLRSGTAITQGTESINTAFRPVENAYARLLQQTRAYEASLQELNGTIVNTFRVNAQNAVEGMRKDLQDTVKDIGTWRREMESAARNMETFQARSRQSTFQTALHYEQDPFSRQRIIDQRRQQVEQELRQYQTQIAAPTTKPDQVQTLVTGARARLSELQQLVGEQQRTRYDLQRRFFEQQVATGQVAPTTNPLTGQQEFVMRVNIRDLERDTLRVRQEEYALDQLIVRVGEQRRTQLEAQRVAQENQVRTAERAFASLAQFRVLNQQGDLNATYRHSAQLQQATRPSITPEQLAREDFERRAAAVVAATPENQRIQMLATIQQLRINYENQLIAYSLRQRIQSESTLEATRRQNLQRELTEREQAKAAAETDLNERVARFRTRGEDVIGATSRASLVTRGTYISEQERDQYIQQIRNAQQAAVRFRQAPTEQNRSEVETSLDEAQRLTNLYRAGSLAVDASGRTVNQTLQAMRESLGGIQTQSQRLDRLRTQVEEISTSLRNLTASTQELARGLGAPLTEAANAASPLVRGFGTLRSDTAAALTSIQAIAAALRNMPAVPNQAILPQQRPVEAPIVAPVNPIQPIPGVQGNPQLPARWMGGPIGTDNLLVRMGGGEFVVNEDSTNRFYTQLLQMNAGFDPIDQHRESVNVGDINITMQSTGEAQTDVRELGRQLRRELQRGTIRFRNA